MGAEATRMCVMGLRDVARIIVLIALPRPDSAMKGELDVVRVHCLDSSGWTSSLLLERGRGRVTSGGAAGAREPSSSSTALAYLLSSPGWQSLREVRMSIEGAPAFRQQAVAALACAKAGRTADRGSRPRVLASGRGYDDTAQNDIGSNFRPHSPRHRLRIHVRPRLTSRILHCRLHRGRYDPPGLELRTPSLHSRLEHPRPQPGEPVSIGKLRRHRAADRQPRVRRVRRP
jgi:hypothetical protein